MSGNAAGFRPLLPFIPCSKASFVGQQAILYAQQYVIENKLNNIIAAAPAYKTTAALKTNIESVVITVLLSSKLSKYKGDVLKEHVLSFILRDRLHIPSMFDLDSYMSNVIKATIAESLIQARSRIKKLVWDGIKNKTKIFDLASKLVKDTKCSVTVPLCGKIAILWMVYLQSPEKDFWDKVDARLDLIRKVSGGDAVMTVHAIKGYLKKDKDTYGSGVHDNIAPEELNPWQQGVDDSLADAVGDASTAIEDA